MKTKSFALLSGPRRTGLNWRCLHSFRIAAGLTASLGLGLSLLPQLAIGQGAGIIQASKIAEGSTVNPPIDAASYKDSSGVVSVFTVSKEGATSILRKFAPGSTPVSTSLHMGGNLRTAFGAADFQIQTLEINDIDITGGALYLAGTVTDTFSASCFFAKCDLNGVPIWATVLSGGKSSAGTGGTQGKAIVVDPSVGGKIYGAGQHTLNSLAGTRYNYTSAGTLTTPTTLGPVGVAAQQGPSGQTAKIALFRLGSDGNINLATDQRMVYWEWNYGVIQNGDPNFGDSVTMSGQASRVLKKSPTPDFRLL